jgi:pimeloyl-ACP methyl ester carboxylesterase
LAISLTAHIRALCIVACCGVPLLSGCALEGDERADTTDTTDTTDTDTAGDDDSRTGTVAQGLATNLSVYTNTALASPWQSWSWSSSVALANTDAPLRSGSTNQIKTTVQSGYGALSLAHPTTDLTIADYDSITFDVRGQTSSSVRLGVETLAGSAGTQVVVPVTTTWSTQTIKLDSLKGALTRFGKINWIGPVAGQTFYVDNITIVAKKVTTTSGTASFPTAPLTVSKNTVVTLNSSASPYFLVVPTAYDATHKTPTKLFVWLHGCGGYAANDARVVSPGGSQSWITVSVGGRDGACWNVGSDATIVLAALDDVKRRLNVDPRRVVIGGYSSGGNLAYRTAFYNARRFAGVLAENTAPFYGTGSSQSASIAAAAWKLNVAHLAHVSDTTYSIGSVRTETDALKTAGFPTTRLERAGTHWDSDTGSSGTNYDLRTYLLPYLDAGWSAPQ